jgi:hypothetical protein
VCPMGASGSGLVWVIAAGFGLVVGVLFHGWMWACDHGVWVPCVRGSCSGVVGLIGHGTCSIDHCVCAATSFVIRGVSDGAVVGGLMSSGQQ